MTQQVEAEIPLRNIALTAPYMHDVRLATLPDVLDYYSEHVQDSPTLGHELISAQAGGLGLAASEKADLLAFLHLLTDTSFVNNLPFADLHFSVVKK